MRNMMTLLAAGVLSIAHAPALAQHWGYAGEAGPDNWSRIDAKNVLCAIGRNQSPVDLGGFVDAQLAPLKFDYKPAPTQVVNNGHAVQVNVPAGSVLTVDGRAFELKQFHFHSPSENRIAGKQFPLEAHLVHADKDGNLAVVAVMFTEGAANAVLAPFWDAMPAKAGDSAQVSKTMAATSLLPAKRDYYRYSGSLTTPPCSEGVRWFVMKTPVSVSRGQVDKFTKTLGFANNRPVQPLNARDVLQ